MAAAESTPTMVGIKRKLSTSVSSQSPATTPGVATKTSQEQQQAAKRRKSSRTNSSGTVNLQELVLHEHINTKVVCDF